MLARDPQKPSSLGLFEAGCFGKLPSFSDFVRHNASGREALAFDEWLHHGMYFAQSQLGRRWEDAFKNAPAYNFLFCPEASGRLLVGSIHFSEDKSGRKYPFLVALFVDPHPLGDERVPLVPVMFSSFFSEAGLLATRAMNGLAMRDIIDQTQALSVQIADGLDRECEHHRAFLENTMLDSFWSQLFGDYQDPKKYLLFRNLLEILLPFQGRNLSRFSLGLRFPLGADGLANAHVTSLWLQMSQRILRISTVVPFLFWTARESPSACYLFLFFRQPSARNFAQLLQPDMQTDTICVLEKEGQDVMKTIDQTLSPQYRMLVDSKDLTLLKFLELL